MALMAHIDSGKTTLTESILLKSAYLTSSGSVDTGSTTTDFLPVERERGITVQSASIPVKWKDWTFNLIDTPGHADFGMEVESASRVVDGAVVLLDSVEGVEAQTKGVWRQLDRYGVGTRIIFLNKLDRAGASFRFSFLSLLKHRLHPNPMILTLPIASFNPRNYTDGEPGIEGLVDLVRWNVWKWEDGEVSCHPLPITNDGLQNFDILPPSHPIFPELSSARVQLLENLSMISEEIFEHLVAEPDNQNAYASFDNKLIMTHLRKASLQGLILPVICGSAIKNVGTEILMDYVGELLPSPLDINPVIQGQNTPVQLLAWKVNWDERRGWMTFVRIYGGNFTRQTSLLNVNRNQREKASKILLLYASEAQEVNELPYGSVGVILGLKYTRTGDTLISADVPVSFRHALADIKPPPSVISASVIPRSHSDLQPSLDALHSLSRTDPSLRVDTQEGQILVHGLGTLHLEIVEGRLKDEWNARVEFGKRHVSYRESLGFNEPLPDWDLWAADVAGKTVSLRVPLNVRRMEFQETGDPAWDGNIVVDEKGRPIPAPDSISGTDIGYVAEGLLNALSNSPHSSLPMTQMRVEVGKLKNFGSRVASILTRATASTLRKRIHDAGIGPILEPFIYLKISVGENNLGKVVKDLVEHDGELLNLDEGNGTTNSVEEIQEYPDNGMYVPPEWLSPSGSSSSSNKSNSLVKRTIRGIAPLIQFLDYSNRLRSMSEGHGTFETLSAGFKEVSQGRKAEIFKEIGRA